MFPQITENNQVFTRIEGAAMNKTNTNQIGYEVPVDPMDDLQCDSCQ
jgi:hypothetical protein